MELVVQVYRLARQIEDAGAARLAEQITQAAAPIPARIAQAAGLHRQEDLFAPAEALLLETETLLLVAVRLGCLPEGQAARALSLVSEVQEALHTSRSVPAEEVPAQAASPAPSSVRAEAGQRGAQTQPPRSTVAGEASKEGKDAGVRKPAGDGTAVEHREQRGREPAHDRLVIDGSNFLGRAPGFMLGDDQSRDRFLFRLQEYARRHPAHRVTVFFDGQHAANQLLGGVEVRVTSGQRPADDVLVDFLGHLPGGDRPRSTVVTDDQDLASRAHRLGVKVEGVSWLFQKLARKPPSGGGQQAGGLSRSDVAEWEDFFNQPPRRPGKR
jgi:four helix bundle protein